MSAAANEHFKVTCLKFFWVRLGVTSSARKVSVRGVELCKMWNEAFKVEAGPEGLRSRRGTLCKMWNEVFKVEAGLDGFTVRDGAQPAFKRFLNPG
ncbi:hypothetical protein BV898_09639 [Hypsibius exemplaris]|uniref:Uncharacterized protein n=1 Tax=Hypsibius exemplaris TaxID=2072580 RepID=A0A1W0WLS6_HYPEX|nr:hypothetical protein BV898_09639 [Hypsibius exemplaris]